MDRVIIDDPWYLSEPLELTPDMELVPQLGALIAECVMAALRRRASAQ